MVVTVASLSCVEPTLGVGLTTRPYLFFPHPHEPTIRLYTYFSPIISTKISKNNKPPFVCFCSDFPTRTMTPPSSSSSEEEEEEEEEEEFTATALSHPTMTAVVNSPPMMIKRRRRYRKQYPGEKKGITEEMRFVAMKLRNIKTNTIRVVSECDTDDGVDVSDKGGGGGDGRNWQPSIEGFLKYLVDSKLVFSTVERIVDESIDVSYAYFRKTGLERSQGLSEDLEWFSQKAIVIPEPSNPGVTYAKYLEELAETSPPLFLCHLYNIYFSHIVGGQVIAKRVSKKLLDERDMEFYRWEGDAEELLRGARENLNMLGEHWTRDEKNKCLREATKSFRFLGQIVRLIIL